MEESKSIALLIFVHTFLILESSVLSFLVQDTPSYRTIDRAVHKSLLEFLHSKLTEIHDN